MNNIDKYNSSCKNTWCPGCGNFGILKALKNALLELELEPHEILIVSGIGQAAKTPHYINTNGFNGLHGRAIPPAVGAKIANRNLKVIITSGDGDSYGEGGNHLIHNIRRNVDITHFVHNNQIYGLTKGQGSPTTALGQKTTMQSEGVTSQQFNPISFAISQGCSFVARSFSGDIDHLIYVMKEAISHRGYALVDILQPCITFNKVNTFQWYKDRIYYLDSQYDSSDIAQAFIKSLEWDDEIPIGIIYKDNKPTFEDRVLNSLEKPQLIHRKWTPNDVKDFMEEFL